MTRIPFENRNIVDRPDLPEYELNTVCAAPGCGQGWGLENHHLLRRSFGTPSYWIELSDGTVVGNRVALCNRHHACVTVNNARILYDEGVFWWQYHGEESRHALTWQPPTHTRERPLRLESQAVFGDRVIDMHTREVVQHLGPQPGETCTACRRRIPHPKKTSTPKSRVWSTRVPLDDADTFSELVDAAAEHHGLTSKPHHRYWTLQCALILLLQAERGELPIG